MRRLPPETSQEMSADGSTRARPCDELGGAMGALEREREFEGVKVCDGHDPDGNIFELRRTR